ncbi:MAG: histidine phosphatase family protein [bacterium]|nr:histidine phosphatase family protein [bacterium]
MTLENRPSLYLVRHAESLQNVNQKLDRDSSLSETGQRQAIGAGISLRLMIVGRRPEAIIHTGLRRTLDTAKLIKANGEFEASLVEMPEFREREMGIYDRMEFLELIRRNPHMDTLYQRYKSSCVWFFDGAPGEGVEPLDEMKARIIGGLHTIYDRYSNKPVVAVAHAGSVKMIRMLYEIPSGTNIAEYLSSYVPKNCQIYRLEDGIP